MNIVFIIVYVIWGLSELLLNRMKRASSEDRQDTDRNSLGMIWMSILVAVSFAIIITQRFSFPIADTGWITYVGLAIILTGILLRFAVVRSLGEFFTVDITIRKDHVLKTDGFFKLVRHPSYAASLLSFAGFGVSLNNWLSLLVVVILILMSFSRRIYIEEKMLTEQFGEAYKNYMSKTKRLIPYVF